LQRKRNRRNEPTIAREVGLSNPTVPSGGGETAKQTLDDRGGRQDVDRNDDTDWNNRAIEAIAGGAREADETNPP
jgi:hypothetical protein